MPLLDVTFIGSLDGPSYLAGPEETVAGRLSAFGAVVPWRAGGVWLSDDASGLRFTPEAEAIKAGLLVEILVRRDVAVDGPDLRLLTVGDLLRYERVGGDWQVVVGESLLPAPVPTSAFPQHIAVLVQPTGQATATLSVWFNGWRAGATTEVPWSPSDLPDVVLGAADGKPACRGFVTAFAVSGVDAGGNEPLFVVRDVPANAIPVNPADDEQTLARKAASVRPTPLQRRWQELELTAFVHFGMATFAGVEDADGLDDPKLFDPAELDCRQWARALKRAGFTMAILTTKHADGFLLWPTRYADYSVAASPWRDGKGDVVREFVDAMRAEGLRVGLYFSPLSRHEMRVRPSGVDPRHHRFGGSEDKGDRLELIPGPGRDVPHSQRFGYVVDEYNAVYLRQLHELLTEYGEIDEVWLDGNADWCHEYDEVRQRYDGRLWYDMARKLQPEVKFFNGWEIRWVGNEDGVARDAEWSVLPVTGDLDGNFPHWTTDWMAPVLGDREQWKDATHLVWHPAEVDVSIRPGWFYHADEAPKTVEQLSEIFVQSIGRNANLLLNVPADTRGLLPDEDITALTAFAEHRARAFGTDVAADFPSRGWRPAQATGTLQVRLTGSTPVRYVEIAEDLGVGQRVESFTVSVRVEGEWVLFGKGSTIGHKRIVDAGHPLQADAVRLEVDAARATPAISALRVYSAEDLE